MYNLENGFSHFLGEVRGLRVRLQGLDELVQRRNEKMEAPKMWLQVGLVLTQRQLELFAEVDALEDQVRQGLDRKEWPKSQVENEY